MSVTGEPNGNDEWADWAFPEEDDEVRIMTADSIPLEDPQATLDWLKTYHGDAYIRSLPDDMGGPSYFDYTGIDVDKMTTAIEALRQQYGSDEARLRETVADLSPMQILMLDGDPSTQFYRADELEVAQRDWVSGEVQRLQHLPEVLQILDQAQQRRYFMHATESISPGLLTDGLPVHYGDELSGVANALRGTREQMLDELARRHRGYSNVVILDMSHPVDYRKRDVSDDRNSGGISYDGYLPPEHIVGVLNLETGNFTDNPTYKSGNS
jgi:hypothetical protein